MVVKLYAIARNTFVETVRQPIFGVLTWTAVGVLILNAGFLAFTLDAGNDIKVHKEVALATMMSFALLQCVFAAGGVVAREIESYTALTVVSKPVPRPLFVIGKYLGVATAILVSYYIMSLTILLIVRHGVMETAADKFDWPVLTVSIVALGVSLIAALFGNYTYGWNFLATLTGWIVALGTVALVLVLCFGKTWKPQPIGTDFGDMQMIYAITLNLLGAMVLTSFAVTLSTRFTQVVTLMLCLGIYVLGLLSDYFFKGPAENGELPFRLAYAIIPNFQYFLVGDAITQGARLLLEQVQFVAAYAGIYTLAILSLGVAMFQTREVG